MWFGAFIGFVLFIATVCVTMARQAIERDDAFSLGVFLSTALALFIVAGMALA